MCNLENSFSEFGLRVQFDIAHDDWLLTFLGLRHKNNRVIFFPGHNNQSFAREHVSHEPHRNLLHQTGVIFEESLLDSACRESHEAEPVKDRFVEAAHRCHVGVHMKGISIVA